MLENDIKEIDANSDSLLLGEKGKKSLLQVFKVDRNKAEIFDSSEDYRGGKDYEVDITKKTELLGFQIKLLKKYYWVILVIFIVYNILNFIVSKEEFFRVTPIIKKILVLFIIAVTYVLICNIGYIYTYSRDNGEDGDSQSKVINIGNDSNDKTDNGETAKDQTNSNKEETTLIGEFVVTEDKKTWGQETELDIFSNKYYNTNKIAPGVDGSYKFRVHNNLNGKVKYDLIFTEENSSDVNLMYKLKRNGQYVYNEYQDPEGIKNLEIDTNSIDEYDIEWKWIDSDNDTAIGENAERTNYKLNIRVEATQVVE